MRARGKGTNHVQQPEEQHLPARSQFPDPTKDAFAGATPLRIQPSPVFKQLASIIKLSIILC